MRPAETLPPIADPERALVLAYAPAERRETLGLLWRLDEQLGRIVATTTDPTIGQIRLTWWHDALAKLGEGEAPAEPLLQALVAVPGLDGPALTPLIEGWEVLLDPLPLDAEALTAYADGRGGGLFAAAAALLGAGEVAGIREAGRLWALADLAFHIGDRTTAERALAAARAVQVPPQRWPRSLRPLSALVMLARRDAEAGLDRPRRPGSPARVARLLVHGLTGL